MVNLQFSKSLERDVTILQQLPPPTPPENLPHSVTIWVALSPKGLAHFLNDQHRNEQKIDTLALNETKLDDSINRQITDIAGFKQVRLDRSRQGGGVSLYVRDSIQYILRNDIPYSNLELLCIEVQPHKSKPFLVRSARVVRETVPYRRNPAFKSVDICSSGVEESMGWVCTQVVKGVLLLHSWLMVHRIAIKLQLTGKSRLIFNSISPSAYVAA